MDVMATTMAKIQKDATNNDNVVVAPSQNAPDGNALLSTSFPVPTPFPASVGDLGSYLMASHAQMLPHMLPHGLAMPPPAPLPPPLLHASADWDAAAHAMTHVVAADDLLPLASSSAPLSTTMASHPLPSLSVSTHAALGEASAPTTTMTPWEECGFVGSPSAISPSTTPPPSPASPLSFSSSSSNRTRYMTDEEKSFAIGALRRGESTRVVAKKVGRSQASIVQLKRKMLQGKPVLGPRRCVRKKMWDSDNFKEKIAEIMDGSKGVLTYETLSHDLHVSQGWVWQACRALGYRKTPSNKCFKIEEGGGAKDAEDDGNKPE